MSDSLVALKKVRKSYGDLIALNDIDLAIDQGQFVVLLGPSGSGKTTLLSILGGFTTPTSGEVWIDGQDVTTTPPARRPTVTVFQDYALFPHMTVSDNVGFGLAMRRVSRSQRKQRIASVLETVGLHDLGGRRIDQLSGGQRQRRRAGACHRRGAGLVAAGRTAGPRSTSRSASRCKRSSSSSSAGSRRRLCTSRTIRKRP